MDKLDKEICYCIMPSGRVRFIDMEIVVSLYEVTASLPLRHIKDDAIERMSTAYQRKGVK